MEVLLIRHAVTAETGHRLTGRLGGVPLSDEGRVQAEALATAVVARNPAIIISSPVQRCLETASIVAEACSLEVTTDDAFEEVDYGSWSGRTLASLRRLKSWARVQAAPSTFRFPGGESLLEMQHRAVAGIERLAPPSRRRPVVICSHGDVIKAITAHYLGQHLDLFQRIVIDPASITHLETGRPAVISMNETPWRTQR